jgi:ubiquitin conjugation factor E4 B
MLDESQTPFHYLLGAWKRAVDTARSIRPDRDPQGAQKLHILTEIKRLCVSYAGLSLIMPDMFGDAPRENDLCGYLMQDIFTEVKLPEEFLVEFALRFHDDGLIDVLGSTLNHIAEDMASLKFNSNSRSVVIRVTTLSPLHSSSFHKF